MKQENGRCGEAAAKQAYDTLLRADDDRETLKRQPERLTDHEQALRPEALRSFIKLSFGKTKHWKDKTSERQNIGKTILRNDHTLE